MIIDDYGFAWRQSVGLAAYQIHMDLLQRCGQNGPPRTCLPQADP